MSDEVLIKAEHVSKKFCRSLKRSLWYGVKDVSHSLVPWNANNDQDAAFEGELPPLRKDEFWAIRDVSFELRRGECLGLIGHNGAGKSTLLKILNSLNRPDAGQITMRGRVGALIELSAGFNPILTGRENIFNQSALLGFSKQETESKLDAIIEFSELEDFLEMPVQNYSSGMKVRLGFAVSSQMEPDILLIDEVLAVGDVGFRFKCLNKMADLLRRCAVIFVSHSMPSISRVCSEVLLLDHGKMLFHGPDVAHGVEKYFSLFHHGEQAVTGSGDAKILSLNLQSGGKQVSQGDLLSIDYGSQLNIATRIRFSEGIKRAKLRFVCWNTELLPVLDIIADNLQGFAFDVPSSGELDVHVSIPQIALSAGKYNLSAIVLEVADQKVYCRHDCVGAISVKAASASAAHVLVPGNWSLSTKTAN